ncbi:MAG: hypothetical protein ABIS18_05505 [Actinomycetota bacterium]
MEERRDDRILDPGFLTDLGSLSIEDLRLRRAECGEVEAELSYARRLLQGKLDILKHEVERRAAGGDPGMEALIGNLQFILADESTGTSLGKHQDVSLPPNFELQRRDIERLASESVLSNIEEISSTELADVIAGLSAVEIKTSEKRRKIQVVHDHLSAEFVRRYRDGSENVEELLSNQL